MQPQLRLTQHPDQVVRLNGWEPDAEFPIGPQGAKAKSILICPTPAPQPFLTAGHRYLFKEPSGIYEQQVWSEVIAYQMSRYLKLQVPPAFLAQGPGNGSPGVLVEFFYGYQGQPQHLRFVHAVERLEGLRFKIDFEKGSLKDNIDLCRMHYVPGWRKWWAQTLTFDALIGNTDRHTENWGFMVETAAGRNLHQLAPVFDNGTSLGYIVRENDLPAFDPARIQRLLAGGRHHCGWVSGDRAGSQHVKLCLKFRDRYMDTQEWMSETLSLSDIQINQIVRWCSTFSFAIPFSKARADFVDAQLRARRDALAAALGV